MSLNDLFQAVYVINMDNDTERLRAVSARLAQLNTTFERITGKVGSENRQQTGLLCRQFCTDGMIGNFLSHITAWRKVVTEGLASALILEDDVVFYPNIQTVLPAAVAELDTDWDMLVLGCHSCGQPTLFDYGMFSIFGDNNRQFSKHLYYLDTLLGTEAYAVSAKGAQKLLELLPKPVYHIDMSLTFLPNVNRLLVKPAVAYQDPEQFSASNNTSAVPTLLNKITDFKMSSSATDGRTCSWYMSMPLFAIGQGVIRIDGWFILVLAMASWLQPRMTTGILLIEVIYGVVIKRVALGSYASCLTAAILGIVIYFQRLRRQR